MVSQRVKDRVGRCYYKNTIESPILGHKELSLYYTQSEVFFSFRCVFYPTSKEKVIKL